MSEDLLDLAVAKTGGHRLWDTAAGLRIDISIGGPIWALKGWPTGATFDQILTVDTSSQRILFRPFTRPDRAMVFDATTDTVRMQTLDGNIVESLSPRQFQGNAAQQRLGRATPGVLPGLCLLELLHHPLPDHLSRDSGPRNRTLAGGRSDLAPSGGALSCVHRHPQPRSSVLLRFPRAATPHHYIAQVNGSALVGHYTSRYRNFDGLLVATRRRVFRRTPDNTVNLNLLSITLDIRNAELIHADIEGTHS